MAPVATWNITTINGVDYLVVDTASFRIPLDWDPSSNMLIAIGVPSGGYGNIPALLRGEPGPTITLDNVINLTVLDYDDPSVDSASLTALTETDYQVNLTIHQGPKGDRGVATLDMGSFGTPVAKQLIVVNNTLDGFVYQPQLVGDSYPPATIRSAPAGNPSYTLCSVSIAAQPFAWRPRVSGQCVISGAGFWGDVQADFIARLNNESSGNIVGRGFGPSGVNTEKIPTVLSSGRPAGTPSSYNTVAANAAAVIFFTVERQTGTETFTTSADTTYCEVRVEAIPA